MVEFIDCLLKLLHIVFFWLGSAFGIILFRENHLNQEGLKETIDRYFYYYIIYNGLVSIFLIALKDFRICLISAIIMCIIHYFECRKTFLKIRKRNQRKKFRILKIEIEKPLIKN